MYSETSMADSPSSTHSSKTPIPSSKDNVHPSALPLQSLASDIVNLIVQKSSILQRKYFRTCSGRRVGFSSPLVEYCPANAQEGEYCGMHNAVMDGQRNLMHTQTRRSCCDLSVGHQSIMPTLFDKPFTVFNDKSPFKRAFYKSSLKHHPDRHIDAKKSLATERFQVIMRAFSILANKESRILYDETGIIGDTFSEKSLKDWCEYFNNIFPKFTRQDIMEAKKKFVGSEEEKIEIAKAYERYKGDMDKVMETVVFAEVFEEDRIRSIINELIDEKKIEPYDAFTKEPANKRARRLKRAQKEAVAFEKMSKRKKLEKGEETSAQALVMSIQSNKEKRQAAADKFIDQLAAKYGEQKRKRPARKGKKSK
nr:dnaj subfamily c [Hymenolepis microstoma]